MADTITLTAEELKQLFEPMFELISKKDRLILQLRKELDESIALITKMEDESRVVPPPPLDWDEEEWKAGHASAGRLVGSGFVGMRLSDVAPG